MTVTLSGSVGRHLRTRVFGRNDPADVCAVQRLLNGAHRRLRIPRHAIAEDGRFGVETLTAIRDFQQACLGRADGLVDAGRTTLDYLNRAADGEPFASAPRRRNYNIRIDPPLPSSVSMTMQNDCWAVVGTLMLAWRRRQSANISVRDTLRGLGGTWLSIYEHDDGLLERQYADFAQACRMTVDYPARTVGLDDWCDLLQRRGPVVIFLPVVVYRGNVRENWVHAHILVGMRGDGSVNGTYLAFVDPATSAGGYRSEDFATFDSRIEEVARLGNRIQIWHF
jgi:peptidoglycan hydrolase-like protein with peptidoglycan-binding domain